MSDSALPSPGGTACAASPPSALNNSCAKWDIVPHAAKDTSCEGAEAGSAQGSIPPCVQTRFLATAQLRPRKRAGVAFFCGIGS